MKLKSIEILKNLSPPLASLYKNVNSIGRSLYSEFSSHIHVRLFVGICLVWSKQLGVYLTSKLDEEYPEVILPWRRPEKSLVQYICLGVA